jgi:polyferredoxin
MHAFEQGKLILLPNTLLWFSLGILAGIVFLWILAFFRKEKVPTSSELTDPVHRILITNQTFINKVLVSRWPQAILTLFAMMMIYIVILTSVLGTQMSGRNLGVLLMWAIWLFLLVALLTPFFGRIWCTICPLPMLGDMFQRKSFFTPETGTTKGYQNKFSGLFLKWPSWLQNDWLRLAVFLLLATFSTTLVAKPRVSGITVLMLLLVPTLMSIVWELRAFCRYVCPVSVFVGSFSRMSPVAL